MVITLIIFSSRVQCFIRRVLVSHVIKISCRLDFSKRRFKSFSEQLTVFAGVGVDGRRRGRGCRDVELLTLVHVGKD